MTSAPTRRRLPNRRVHLVLDFEHGGFAYTAGVGFFDDAGEQPAEIFLTTAKHGTVLDTQRAARGNSGERYWRRRTMTHMTHFLI